jgi:DNA-directed RNA polymerase subunit RPC12/RpoP
MKIACTKCKKEFEPDIINIKKGKHIFACPHCGQKGWYTNGISHKDYMVHSKTGAIHRRNPKPKETKAEKKRRIREKNRRIA